MTTKYRPEAELRVTLHPYVAFSIMGGGIVLAGIATLPSVQVLGIVGDPIGSYYIIAFGLLGWLYVMFSIYWHQHIIDGDILIFKRGMKFGIIPIKKIIPIASITRLRREPGFRGREYDGLSIYYGKDGTEEHISIVLEAHRPTDLRHFLTVLKQKRPDLEIPLIDGRKPARKRKAAVNTEPADSVSLRAQIQVALRQLAPWSPRLNIWVDVVAAAYPEPRSRKK